MGGHARYVFNNRNGIASICQHYNLRVLGSAAISNTSNSGLWGCQLNLSSFLPCDGSFGPPGLLAAEFRSGNGY